MKAKASKKAPLITRGYIRVNREIVAELASLIPTTLTNDTVLTAANQAISSPGIKPVLASQSNQANILLTTSPSVSASSVEPYYESLAFAR